MRAKEEIKNANAANPWILFTGLPDDFAKEIESIINIAGIKK